MAQRYCHLGLSTGANNGTSWTDAFRTIQTAFYNVAAGDVILCKGTEILTNTATLSIPGNFVNGFIKFIGVASSYNGTDPVAGNTGGDDRAKLTSSSGISLIMLTGAAVVWFENFELESTSTTAGAYHGLTVSTASNTCVFINVWSHGHKGSGLYINALSHYSKYYRCKFTDNGVTGIWSPRLSALNFCYAGGNSSDGFHGYDTDFYGCISENNGARGYYLYGGTGRNCIAHNNTTVGFDFQTNGTTNTLIGCRATGNGTGVNIVTSTRITILGYYGDNTTEYSGYIDSVLIDGAGTVIVNGTDTDEGYVDSANGDFNLASGASLRRLAIPLP